MKTEYTFVGKSVYLEDEKAVVISDLHIGYEEALDIAMPRGQFKEIIDEMGKIFEFLTREKKKVEEIIILGDLKHEFSRNIMQEWNEVRKFFSFLRENVDKMGEGKIILIKGNHDNFIETIASKYGVETKEYYIENEKAFIHGDKRILSQKESKAPDLIDDKKIKKIFMGHFHPAILIEEAAKREIYKCFLRGEWKGKEIIILPSFFPLIEGVDVNKEDMNENSLAYKFDLRKFRVYIPISAEEVLDFGEVRDVRRLG